MRRLIAAALVVVACSACTAAATQAPATLVPARTVTAAPATAAEGVITLHAGDPTLVDYRGGRYTFAWTLAGGSCSLWDLEIAPTSGATPIVLHAPGPGADGSVTVDVPAGRAYLNGSGCGYTITITPA